MQLRNGVKVDKATKAGSRMEERDTQADLRDALIG